MEKESDQIGERLRQAREDAGWTVDDVVFQTRIPRSVVVALEEGDFSVFSSPTYARSFLAQYSGFVNVDATPWLDALEPVAYFSGDVVHPAIPQLRSRSERGAGDAEPGRGWIAAASTLAISCGLIYAAVKGYEMLEHRFGGETAAPEMEPEMRMTPRLPLEVEARAPEPLVESLNASQADAEPSEPPPRAVIVR